MTRPVHRAARGLCVVLGLLLGVASTSAQTLNTPDPPGPFAIDLRGATVGIPQSPSFYPTLPAGTIVPARGFGIDVGAHVYPWEMRGLRIGVGANLVQVRGSATTVPVEGSDDVGPIVDVTSHVRVLAPQVSINFGTAKGWSYLSGGPGIARVRIERAGAEDARQDSGNVSTVNLGGGARWFFSPHVAVTFDLRFYRLSSSTLFAATAGLSFK